MIKKNNDPFAWRKGGGHFQIGDGDEGGVMDIFEVDNNLLCITRKGIHSIYLADSVDPNRTNPSLPHSQQKILSYGSDEQIVGRTLMQAKLLFEKHALPDRINCSTALSIALAFLKELISLHEIAAHYVEEEKEKNLLFAGSVGSDMSLRIPAIGNIEQRAKQFLTNADHATRHLMAISQLFYPDIKNEKWAKQLNEKLENENGKTHPITKFTGFMGMWVWLMRNLRNAIEHPKSNDRVEFNDYTLASTGEIKPPTILYKNDETPLQEMFVSQLMVDTIENLLFFFETFVAYLCNIHAEPFAGDRRFVSEISDTNRAPGQVHVRFGYQIDWTK